MKIIKEGEEGTKLVKKIIFHASISLPSILSLSQREESHDLDGFGNYDRKEMERRVSGNG